MNRCILHVGIPKTGTSSIQESLFFGLDDPRFEYVTAGHYSSLRLLQLLGSEAGIPDYVQGAQGRDPAYLAKHRQLTRRQFEHRLAHARRSGRQLILSGESCWRMSRSELSRLKTILEQGGYSVQVMAYLRPWKDWLESVFAQRCQAECIYGGQPWRVSFLPSKMVFIDYAERIATFDGVFGRENVLFRKYDPATFTEGCVTRDFCELAGVTLAPDQIRRANPSVRRDGVRFLFAYGRYGNREAPSGRWSRWQHGSLIQRLLALRGPSLRFHSSVVEPILNPLLPHLAQVEERIGAPLREDWRQHDATDCVRTEADLFRFSPESLDWLAEQTGQGFSAGMTDVALAQEVADRIHRLRHQFPGVRHLLQSAQLAAERHWTAWRKRR